MKTRNYSVHILPLIALAGGLVLTGCTDSNYDLGNLDKTIAIGSEDGFSLPGNNSTSALVLDDVLDLENNDLIKVASDGGYYISRGADEDDIDPALPVVDEIPLTKVANESDYDYDINEGLDVDEARRVEGATSPTERAIYEFSFNSLDDIANVLGMSLANLRAGINVDLNFSDDLKLNIDNLVELTIDLPDFFDVDFTAKETTTNFEFDKNINRIKFTNLKTEGVHLFMTLNGVDFNKGMTPDAHGCYLKFAPEGVSMEGGIWLDAKYDNTASARKVAPGVNEDLIIHCHSSIDETIMLTKATGYFNPEIDLGENIGEFEVNSLPDFLEDEGVHLNVANPELRVWIESNMDIRGLITSAQINAFDEKGHKVEVPIDTKGLAIDPHTGFEKDAKGDSLKATKTKLIICEQIPAVAKKEAHTYYSTPMKGKKLADLLYNIPKKVTFDFAVSADPSYEGTIQLGYKDPAQELPWYKIQPSYEIYAPLAFNAGSAIVYRDSITGWNKDLDDITLSQGATVTLTADVFNNMPLDLKMHAHAIELTGTDSWKDMDDNLVEVKITDMNDDENFKIKAGTESNVTVTRIKITLIQKSQEAFKHIDGIRYSASALASEDSDKQGIILNNKSQKLQVNNIAITLHGRIIVDLND